MEGASQLGSLGDNKDHTKSWDDPPSANFRGQGPMVNGTKKKTPKMLQEFNLAVLIVDEPIIQQQMTKKIPYEMTSFHEQQGDNKEGVEYQPDNQMKLNYKCIRLPSKSLQPLKKPPLTKWWFLLDDDKPLYFKKWWNSETNP